MKRLYFVIIWTILLTVMTATFAVADPLTLTLVPAGGALSGAPGSLVGWGFSLTNSGDAFAVITSADFCGAVPSSPCSTPLGSFTDFIGPSFTVVDPFSSVSAAFDAATFSGIGSYFFNSAAPIGGSFAGQIILTYDLYEDLSGMTLISTDNRVGAAASVTVPEPSTLILLLVGMMGICWVSQKRAIPPST